MHNTTEIFDIVVIGAGPAGAVSSALLNKKGYRVLVIEKQHFPRFSIGESMLPQCMTYLEQAGMLDAVEKAQFQYKNGAAFCRGNEYEHFDFREKFSPGWGTTFQVQRDSFDKILADESAKQGVTFRYGHTLTDCVMNDTLRELTVQTEQHDTYKVQARFVLDASGFGRVLPKLLNLEKPSTLGSRKSVFTHVKDNMDAPDFDRNKILITVHPKISEVWFWLIPFSNGRSSVGVVAPPAVLESMQGSPIECLQQLITEGGKLATFLKNAEFDTQCRTLGSYSCDVTSLYGDGYALLGNAGEFLDPIFSSGVTIALTSASLASEVVDKQLSGLQPDWNAEYAQKLKVGVNTFKEFVEGWYDERFQNVVFSKQKSENITRMISSILAGYAWDTENPYVRNPSRLTTLAQLCQND
ncbi:NAD(P)/FAD-dependent oxidoreductase [Alteromonas sp. 1_MG-2023]|uniref:NAD(P)/FAD-dependent oxidoreductase n=1 Tax=Alteromonas sp. 1_MG-2023 TaxID=3062669 RepID=UPI0026E4806D|nr:NAD(P)/FAD-dependent oxidoreductase [Alteromonas sp. 1_MG-2023]MDO6566965.1 NAD(P)/FAD-dependent oxidoreductase [Alteromonas sp. 1_MG-2023]